jgi:hypothetical protein
MKNPVSIILLLLFACHAFGADNLRPPTSLVPPAAPAGVDTATKASSAIKPVSLAPMLKKKRAAVLAGNAFLLAAALIDYGLVMPAARNLDSNDIEGTFSLLSPQMLALGLRVGGPPMCCMRTSEAAAAYQRQYGVKAPKNRSWTYYFCGWGFYAASTALSVIGSAAHEPVLTSASTAVAITADMTWLFSGLYSLFYLEQLGVVPQTVEAPKVSAGPCMTKSGAGGVACVIRF